MAKLYFNYSTMNAGKSTVLKDLDAIQAKYRDATTPAAKEKYTKQWQKLFNDTLGKRANEVSLYEAALLAGLLKAPSRLNPLRNPDQAEARTALVLTAMSETGLTDGIRPD